MTAGPASEARHRLLRERRDALAARRAPADLPAAPGGTVRLMCEAGGQLFALDPAAVSLVRPFHCHPVPLLRPGAAATVLGAVLLDAKLYSVLSLARLFGGGGSEGGETAGENGGTMLLLRPPRRVDATAASRNVALRVDRVDGAHPVAPIGDGRRGRPAGPDAGSHDGRLALLLDGETIAAAIAALDAPARPRNEEG